MKCTLIFHTVQGDIETTGEHTIPYGRVAPNSPWFCSELRGCSDRYPEDCVEGPRKAPRKWKSSVSAFCIAGSASSHGLNCSAPRLRGEQLVTESFCNISSVHSTDASDARVDSAASAWTRGEGASQSSSLRATVIPVYIPGVRSVPKGRSWCSLATKYVMSACYGLVYSLTISSTGQCRGGGPAGDAGGSVLRRGRPRRSQDRAF